MTSILKSIRNFISAVLAFIVISQSIDAQQGMIDQVVAVVGNNAVLLSDVENQVLQFKSQGSLTPRNQLRCEILEDLLIQKLLLNQAQIDSIEITEGQVEIELERRLQMFISQIGSEQKLEGYYNKSILEIKDDFRDLIRNQMLTQQMQETVVGDMSVTPSEVRNFYNKIPKDSLPLINLSYEISQIVKEPPLQEQTKYEVRERLLNLRKRVIDGESFATLAVLYSEDPNSAARGGELGFFSRADMLPEFSEAAFSLRENTVSSIIETDFGYHIIQLIARRGNQVNARHILMKPKIKPEEELEAINFLDSIADLIRQDSISFTMAARYFSNDKLSRTNGGVMVNPVTGDTKFEIEHLDPSVVYAIRNLKIGEISDAFESTDRAGNTVYKIVLIKSTTKPHQANLKQDYSMMQYLTMEEKQQEVFHDWLLDKQKITYIRVNDQYKSCKFSTGKWIK